MDLKGRVGELLELQGTMIGVLRVRICGLLGWVLKGGQRVRVGRRRIKTRYLKTRSVTGECPEEVS